MSVWEYDKLRLDYPVNLKYRAPMLYINIKVSDIESCLVPTIFIVENLLGLQLSKITHYP